jgi:rhodanese-related sulfurtransferase
MPRAIDRGEVRRLVAEEDAQLVDVLPREEYESEHLLGAINIPLRDVARRAAEELERSRPVIVYCYDAL